MSFFSRLQTYRDRQERKPNEDFLTEIFAEFLRQLGAKSRDNFWSLFSQTLLHRPWVLNAAALERVEMAFRSARRLRVDTRFAINVENGTNFPDIAIFGEQSAPIALIEVKIAADETEPNKQAATKHSQLRRYDQWLYEQWKNGCSAGCLMFLTDTTPLPDGFLQDALFRCPVRGAGSWYEVHRWLARHTEDLPISIRLLADYFREYLEDKSMMSCQINSEDIAVLDTFLRSNARARWRALLSEIGKTIKRTLPETRASGDLPADFDHLQRIWSWVNVSPSNPCFSGVGNLYIAWGIYADTLGDEYPDLPKGLNCFVKISEAQGKAVMPDALPGLDWRRSDSALICTHPLTLGDGRLDDREILEWFSRTVGIAYHLVKTSQA